MWDEKIKTHTSSIAKTTLKPRTRPPQFLNHSPFGWSWTHMSPPAMPWQQPISTSLSNPDQTDSASLFLAHIKPIKPRSQDLREINFELREKKFELKVRPCGVKIEKKLISLWCFGVMWGVLFWIYLRLILCWSGFFFWVNWLMFLGFGFSIVLTQAKARFPFIWFLDFISVFFYLIKIDKLIF